MVINLLYLGWVGAGNLGDDILYSIFKRLMNEIAQTVNVHLLIDNSTDNYEVSFEQYGNHIINLRQYNGVILGGGSIIHPGFPFFDVLEQALDLQIPVFIWGSGIDLREGELVDLITLWRQKNLNLRRLISLSAQNTNELMLLSQQLQNTFSNINHLQVRGPITKYLLNNEKAEVIGDPAIIAAKLNYQPVPLKIIDDFIEDTDDVVLMNWGTGYNNIIGKNEEKVAQQLEGFIQLILAQNYKVIVYPIWTKDIPKVQSLVSHLDHPRVLGIDKVYDLYGLAYMTTRTKFSINLKLHASIIAMAFGQPFLSLAYGLKCFDFAESIDSTDLLIPTDRVTPEILMEKMKYIEQHYQEIQIRFQGKLSEYHGKHINYAKQIISAITGLQV